MNLLPDVSGDVSKFNSEEKIGSLFLPGKFCEVAILETCNRDPSETIILFPGGVHSLPEQCDQMKTWECMQKYRQSLSDQSWELQLFILQMLSLIQSELIEGSDRTSFS